MIYDVVIIGGGPAGMGASIECAKHKAKVLLIEKEDVLGGILNQCIHNGFGLHYFNEELTGPEYANRFIELIKGNKINVMTGTFVKNIQSGLVTCISKKGEIQIKTKSIICAMGCREKTAGAIRLNGTRPVGVYTAGQVQRLVNYYGKLPGKNVVILGSGDIGLIMARRLTYCGAKVQMVLEIMPTSGGLQRNISQCLDDNNIPIFYNTTVTEVIGEKRITGIKYASVDSFLKPIKETEKYVDCDCLVLSVGLIPENTLLRDAKMLASTSSFVVNEYRETSISGIFACGNVLQVHDLVDNVTNESFIAGKNACLFAKNKLNYKNRHEINVGDGIKYTLPVCFYEGKGDLDIYFRVSNRIDKKYVVLSSNNKIIGYKYFMAVVPSSVEKITINKQELNSDIEIFVKDKL